MDGIPQIIDGLATQYAAVPGEGEIERARQTFDGRRGKVYDDDDLYQTHMACFLEWYVLERVVLEGMTPAEHALATDPPHGQELDLVLALSRSQRGLFEMLNPVADGGGCGTLIHDLLLGGRWRVESAAPLAGLEPGDIFEARLIPWEGQVRFGPVFYFHPTAATPAIHTLLDGAAQRGALDDSIICDLAEMRLRYSRFRNIAVDRIYTTQESRS